MSNIMIYIITILLTGYCYYANQQIILRLDREKMYRIKGDSPFIPEPLFPENITAQSLMVLLEVKMMNRILDDNLIYEILSVVDEIPQGKVATYGQIARLIGREKNARLVGKVLSMSEYYGRYPCHRVVNHSGRLVPGWTEQWQHLTDEDVVMKDENHVALKLCQWDA